MKRTLILVFGLLLVFGLTQVAMATPPDMPPKWCEDWSWADAEFEKSGGHDQKCNDPHNIELIFKATVLEWAKVWMTYTEFEWTINKPNDSDNPYFEFMLSEIWAASNSGFTISGTGWNTGLEHADGGASIYPLFRFIGYQEGPPAQGSSTPTYTEIHDSDWLDLVWDPFDDLFGEWASEKCTYSGKLWIQFNVEVKQTPGLYEMTPTLIMTPTPWIAA